MLGWFLCFRVTVRRIKGGDHRLIFISETEAIRTRLGLAGFPGPMDLRLLPEARRWLHVELGSAGREEPGPFSQTSRSGKPAPSGGGAWGAERGSHNHSRTLDPEIDLVPCVNSPVNNR